ncbi:MAG: 1-(5-phosphoribosyl)-5-[(5-phosphoribosylamino)methylideneamino]imidazole-4-carboxamide isomerase [Puia sp.]|nr:1-(5-phosphoribosyl)-5-[(5-phosphoribosylamino)methylideneamino]imidazole-4-carboxamide isomerase [Puia sp.]
MQIKEAPLDQVLKMRQTVMYPYLPLEEVRIKEDPIGTHIGLYVEEELVSVISVFVEGDEMRFRKFATQTHLQRRGYGTQLFLHVLKLAETLQCRKLWCLARVSVKGFYEKYGFKTVGDVQYNKGIDFIKMEKTSSMEVIPAIDIIDGKCVRLTQGDYAQKKIYNEDPLEVAREFEDAGLRRLHLVDLDGAREGAVKNWKVLETIAGKTALVIDFGGGIKTAKDVDIVLNSGAKLATIGSIAVKNGAVFLDWLQSYGADKFLLGADVKGEKIAVGGWLETTDLWVYDFIGDYLQKGVKQVFCTDVGKDGLLEGPSLELYRNILAKFPGLHFIASGGVSNIDDVHQLAEIGCSGVIIGKAIYEGRISLRQLSGI